MFLGKLPAALDHHGLFSPVTTADKADYVAMLVEDFLTDFKELYPEAPHS